MPTNILVGKIARKYRQPVTRRYLRIANGYGSLPTDISMGNAIFFVVIACQLAS